MDTPEEKELERFIDAHLKKLPEYEAPEDLASSVMAAILAREALPWWKQPFTEWPRHIQTFFFIALAALSSFAAWLAAQPAKVVSVDALAEQASSWSWVLESAEGFLRSVLLVLRGLSWEWFAGFCALFLILYGACLAAGFALYRVTAHAARRTA
jgi:hypothetical protein